MRGVKKGNDIMIQQIIQWVIIVGSALGVILPLAMKLTAYIEDAAKGKNWGQLVALVEKYVTQAETLFKDGAKRKDWVLAMVKASADTVNYDINMDVVSELVDSLCALAKQVNVKPSADTTAANTSTAPDAATTDTDNSATITATASPALAITRNAAPDGCTIATSTTVATSTSA
jgi:hypothetical protein